MSFFIQEECSSHAVLSSLSGVHVLITWLDLMCCVGVSDSAALFALYLGAMVTLVLSMFPAASSMLLAHRSCFRRRCRPRCWSLAVPCTLEILSVSVLIMQSSPFFRSRSSCLSFSSGRATRLLSPCVLASCVYRSAVFL